jgi:hypothetical protein
MHTMKYCLRDRYGSHHLLSKELSSLLTQARVCLNFCPLTALSNDQNCLTYLSSGHFLIGAPLTCFPEPNLSALSVSHLSRR